MKRVLTILALLALALPAAGQVTLDELDAAADQTDTAMDEFRARLNDPDPDRALAVLQLLVTKGDANQRRLAIRHGLQSTDRAIQATTLRAILDSGPVLRAVFDPVSAEPTVHFGRTINGAGGVLDATGSGSVTFRITGFDEAEDCWTHTQWNTCLLRMRGDEISLLFGSSWGTYRLNGSGQLVGEQAVEQNLAQGTIDLSE